MAGSLVAELAARGHRVLLAFDSWDQDEDSTTGAYDSIAGVESVTPIPRASALARKSTRRDLRLMADFLRYDAPAFRNAPYLQERMEKYVSGRRREIRIIRRLRLSRVFVAVTRALERWVTPDPAIRDAIAAHQPDVVLVSPLIARGRNGVQQTETVKACQALGIPVAALISSWDHLTSKGIIKVVPDRVLVWNEAQALEARRFHGVPRERIVVTGAHVFDIWFGRRPSLSRNAFLADLGLPVDRDCLLYVGSSPNVTPPDLEIQFVSEWLAALRTAEDTRVATAGVLIRPHPGTVAAWANAALPDLGGVAIAPHRRPSMPMSKADEDLYLNSIQHADVVVGINTSAILESFIQRKPVLTVRVPTFAATQSGTLHYRHLVPETGGALREALSFPEHIRQVGEALAAPAQTRRAIEGFVRSFLRPHGLDRPTTPIAADALEALAARAA